MTDPVDLRVAAMLQTISAINGLPVEHTDVAPDDELETFKNLYGFALVALEQLSRAAGIPACLALANAWLEENARLVQLLEHDDTTARVVIRSMNITQAQIGCAIAAKRGIAETLLSLTESDGQTR